MRIYIMTDLEGVCGVMNFDDWCMPQSRYYERGRELLTLEVNAAIEGFLEAGATEFTVADGHGAGAINGVLLHPAASLMRGWPPDNPYPFGLDGRDHDFCAWVGQHAKAGSIGAHLAHTGDFDCRDDSINGISVGEFGRVAFAAAEVGVRVIFAAGDEAFAKEAQALAPGIETAAGKRGTNTEPGHELPRDAYARLNVAAIHLHPEEARRRIRAGARRALARAQAESFEPLTLKAPFERVIVLRSDQTNPPRVARTRHATSVNGLLNAPQGFKPILAADPLRALAGAK